MLCRLWFWNMVNFWMQIKLYPWYPQNRRHFRNFFLEDWWSESVQNTNLKSLWKKNKNKNKNTKTSNGWTFFMLDLSYISLPVQSPTVLVKSFRIWIITTGKTSCSLYSKCADLPLQILLMSLIACLLSPSHKGTFMRAKLITLNA